MKINFGKHRNRNIIIGNNKKMRPTTAMVKDVIFNTISLDDKVTLDLFGGTGALTWESLSLNSKQSIIIEKNIECIRAYKEMDELLKFEDRLIIRPGDFRVVIKKMRDIDVLFIDPPFSVDKFYSIALDAILKYGVLANDGIIVLEKTNKLIIKELDYFEIIKTKKIGDKEILFLQLKHE